MSSFSSTQSNIGSPTGNSSMANFPNSGLNSGFQSTTGQTYSGMQTTANTGASYGVGSSNIDYVNSSNPYQGNAADYNESVQMEQRSPRRSSQGRYGS